MSNFAQPAVPSGCILALMRDGMRLLAVELDGDEGLLVTFSDGTIGGYVIEELLALRPYRERLGNKSIHDPAKGPNYDNLQGEADRLDRQQLQEKASSSSH